MNISIIIPALLTPFLILSIDFVEGIVVGNVSDFSSETTDMASYSFENQKDIVEFKNYVNKQLLVRFLDDKRALVAPVSVIRQFVRTPMTPEYDYIIPAAHGSGQNELGYVRIQLPKDILSKTFTIILYETEMNEDGSVIKARNGQGVTGRPVAQFTMQSDAERRNFMVSVERSKGKIRIRPQKSQRNGLGKTMHSGITKKQNIKAEDVSKNLIR